MPLADRADIAIIGAGAAGLLAAIWAGRTARQDSRHGAACIVLVDGARHIGAKILVAGGGRCNVTHDVVDERAYAGSSRNAIRKVLKRFDVARTIDFFRDLGVQLKREDTGKLFPTTDEARTVLDALMRAVRGAGVDLRHSWRVARIQRIADGFEITSNDARNLFARQVVLATGGMSLPKTGSDGAGFDLARGLGHSTTERIFPALVPLILEKNSPLLNLSGISAQATLEVRSGNGNRLVSFTDSTLCTHFGLSGPGPLDISRYLTDARFEDPDAYLIINWLPGETVESLDRALAQLSRSKNAVSCGRLFRERNLPARLVEVLCTMAGVDASAPANLLTREQRRMLVKAAIEMLAPVVGDRGFSHAEVTAGGVPLSELRLETMESRVCPRLHIIGEMCDVDGRIGGYNFQWAWASGYVAGIAAAQAMKQ
jgi:predicted Rossmann fold flavoprotein